MEDQAGSGMESWPIPVRIVEGTEKLVRLSGLPQSLKLKAWAEIKTNCPPLADLLKDPALKEVMTFFSAELFIEASIAPCLPPERLRGRNVSG